MILTAKLEEGVSVQRHRGRALPVGGVQKNLEVVAVVAVVAAMAVTLAATSPILTNSERKTLLCRRTP